MGTSATSAGIKSTEATAAWPPTYGKPNAFQMRYVQIQVLIFVFLPRRFQQLP